jgi:nicotinamidase/pyrazinamidase
MTAAAMRIEHTALILVDIQWDFLPSGRLAVADGDAILDPVDALMRADRFELMLATQDWHPPGHYSFASTHPGHAPFDTIERAGHAQVLWPDHCVAGSEGAALYPDLPWERVEAIIRKGTSSDVDSYSGFRNNWDAQGHRPPTGLDGYLHARGITDVFVAGLARDYCVKWTAEDAVEYGFRTTVLWDLTRPVDPASNDAVAASLSAKGVTVLESAALGVTPHNA